MEIIKFFQVDIFMPVTKFRGLTIWLFAKGDHFVSLVSSRDFSKKRTAKIGDFALRKKGREKTLIAAKVVKCCHHDLQILKDALLTSPKNPVIAQLNLNSLKSKINDLRILIQDIPLDYFVLIETKLDKIFPTAQFHITGYEIRAKKDRNKYGDGLIEYVKKETNMNLFGQN